jgi:hypothetical protein
MRLSQGVAIAGGVVLLVACGGSDDDPVASSAPVTIVATTDVPDTTTATTAVPATAESAKSTAPPTTDDPTQALIAEIEVDLNEGEQALLTAIAAPSNPASEELVRKHFAGTSLESVLVALADLEADGLVGRPNPEIPSILEVRGIEQISADGDSARVLVCRVDAAVIVDPLPGGGEAIVNDRVTAAVSSSDLLLVDGTWIVTGGDRVEDLPGATTCD